MSRGRTANTPDELPAEGWKDIVYRVKDEVVKDRIGLMAAGVAFYSFLAIFPAIAAVMALSGLFFDPTDITDQLGSLTSFLPEEIIRIIVKQARAVTGSNDGGLGLTALLGFAIALYSASKGVGSLIEGINVAYDEVEERGFVELKLVTLALTLLLVFGLLISLAVTLALPVMLSFIDLGDLAEPVFLVVSFTAIALLTVVGLSVLYRYGPSRDAPEWSWVSVGGVVGSTLWIVGSAGFAYYVKTFGSYNESFGTLAGVVILLTWFWLSAFIVLLGAELNAEMEAQTRRDTTKGPDRPMGQRDAVKADELGETVGK